jgi:hypothetical protein
MVRRASRRPHELSSGAAAAVRRRLAPLRARSGRGSDDFAGAAAKGPLCPLGELEPAQPQGPTACRHFRRARQFEPARALGGLVSAILRVRRHHTPPTIQRQRAVPSRQQKRSTFPAMFHQQYFLQCHQSKRIVVAGTRFAPRCCIGVTYFGGQARRHHTPAVIASRLARQPDHARRRDKARQYASLRGKGG